MEHFENFKLEKEFSRIWIKLHNTKIENFYKFSKMKKLISEVNPIYKKLYKYKKCKRNLKYIGDANKRFTHGKIYKSSKFNGATYIIKFNPHKVANFSL